MKKTIISILLSILTYLIIDTLIIEISIFKYIIIELLFMIMHFIFIFISETYSVSSFEENDDTYTPYKEE